MTLYKERTLEKQIIELSSQFKVLLITGARQVGKSTLLKHCDKNRDYVTLDDYKARELAINEPELFLQRYKAPIIIDEIQYAPNLLSYIKIAVDNSDEKGQYWLTGSQQFHMMKNFTESLAGRVAVLDLKGFSLKEILSEEQIPFIPTNDFIEKMRKSSTQQDLTTIYELIWKGSYPDINVNNSNWETPKTLESGAISGTMFETFVISEIIKSYAHNAKTPNIYYYRDKDKKEIDVIIEKNDKLYPIEIKKTANPDKSMLKHFSVIPEEKRGEGAVICLCNEDFPITGNVNAIPIGYV